MKDQIAESSDRKITASGGSKDEIAGSSDHKITRIRVTDHGIMGSPWNHKITRAIRAKGESPGPSDQKIKKTMGTDHMNSESHDQYDHWNRKMGARDHKVNRISASRDQTYIPIG